MKFKKIVFAGLLLILSYLAIFPRITEVVNHNYLFMIDQGRDYMALKKIVIDGKPTLIGSEIGSGMAGFKGIFQGPFHYYFLTIPFVLFRGDPYGGVVLMFIFGILSVIVSFLLGKKIFGFMGGWLLAILVAISPPFIAHSRFVWNPHPSAFFIVLAFFFTYLSYTKDKKFLFLAAFFSGFLYNFEIPISAPICVGLVMYSIFILRLKILDEYASLFLGFFLAFLPMILFDIRHGFQAIRGAADYLFLVSHLESQTQGLIQNHSKEFIHNFFDTFPKQTLISQFTFSIVFFVSALFFFIREKKKELRQFIFFLLITAVITFLILSFLRNIVFMYYLVHLNIIYIFLFVYIVTSSFIHKIRILQVLSVLVFLIFLIHAIPFAWNNFSQDLNDYGGIPKIKGKIDAIDYIYKDAKGEKFGLLVFTPPVYTYPYDYLVWWYGDRNYHYIPHQEKNGLFYLLIEPDLTKPWSYKGWLETVIKTGTVIETKELPSGFIIQKRISE